MTICIRQARLALEHIFSMIVERQFFRSAQPDSSSAIAVAKD